MHEHSLVKLKIFNIVKSTIKNVSKSMHQIAIKHLTCLILTKEN